MNSGNVTTPEGVTLPQCKITGDPLFGAIFDLTNNPAQLTTIAYQVYLAHEAYTNATGMYRAFSEGQLGQLTGLMNGWCMITKHGLCEQETETTT